MFFLSDFRITYFLKYYQESVITTHFSMTSVKDVNWKFHEKHDNIKLVNGET